MESEEEGYANSPESNLGLARETAKWDALQSGRGVDAGKLGRPPLICRGTLMGPHGIEIDSDGSTSLLLAELYRSMGLPQRLA